MSDHQFHSIDTLATTVDQLRRNVQGGLGLAAVQLEYIRAAQAHLDAALAELPEELSTEVAPAAEIAASEHEEEIAPLDSDEAYEITRRYFWARRGDPTAYQELHEHLLKNNIAIDSTRELKKFMSYWMDDIQQDLADLGLHGRWTTFNGSPVFAEVAAPTPKLQVPVTPNVSQSPAPERPQPLVQPPVEKVREPEVSFDVSEHLQAILADTHFRYNHVRRVLAEAIGFNLDTTDKCLQQAIDDGFLFDFRYHGARNLTLDEATAQQLNTERVRSKKGKVRKSVEQQRAIDTRTLVDIVYLFAQAGTHLQQAKTFQEISNESGRALDTVKPAVRTLCADKILVAVDRPLNKGGHRTASQRVVKFHLISQAIKAQLKQAANLEELTAVLEAMRNSSFDHE